MSGRPVESMACRVIVLEKDLFFAIIYRYKRSVGFISNVKGASMKVRILLVSVFAACCAQARTVAWWHFNEGANGQSTVNGAPTILNAVDTSKLALKAGVVTSKGELPENLDGYLPGYLPVYTNAFPYYATWGDPAGGKGEDNRGMYFNPEKSNGGGGCGSLLYTEVTDDLKLKTMTVELFFKSDYTSVVTGWKHLIVLGGHGTLDTWGLRVTDTGGFQFRAVIPDSSVEAGYKSVSPTWKIKNPDSKTVLDGRWHHIALQIDNDSKKVTLFCDYVNLGSHTLDLPDGLVYVDEPRRLEIGSFYSANYGRWRGWIDEVRISDTILKDSEFLVVDTLVKRVPAPAFDDPDTVFYSSFDSVFDDWVMGWGYGLNEAGGANAYPARIAIPCEGAYPLLSTENMPFDSLHSGIFGVGSERNGGYWNFVTNKAGISATIDIDDNRVLEDGSVVHDLTSGDCTMEMFVRSETSFNHSIYLVSQNTSSGGGSLWVELLHTGSFKVSLLPAEGGTMVACQTSAYPKGGWHHVALVLNRSAKTAAFYVDYSLKHLFTDIVVNSTSGSTSYPYLQLLGGYGHTHPRQLQGSVDSIRLTKRVLGPHEFLKKGIIEEEPIGRVRAWISFDNDYTVKPRTNDIPAGTVSSDSPGFLTSVPGAVIEDMEENVLMSTNRACAIFPGAGAVKFARNILADSADMQSQTLEFYMRLDQELDADWVNLVRFNDADSGDVVYSVRIRPGDEINVRVDTAPEPPEGESSLYFNQGCRFLNAGVSDGRWHHVAVTFEPDEDGENTVVKLYVDRRYFGKVPVRGLLRTVGGGDLSNTSLTIGAGNIYGAIDEVRISQGVLDVKDMMRATRVKLPFAVILR